MAAGPRLDRRTVREIEQSLGRRRLELVRAVQSAIGRVPDEAATRPDDAPAASVDDELRAALTDRMSRQVARVETALLELHRGEYGLCRDCGRFIGIARLRALPLAERCVACQARAEREERRRDPPAVDAWVSAVARGAPGWLGRSSPPSAL
jgi:DnaK suppressor protein